MDLRKKLTQQNYSGVANLYTADFGNDNEHFDFFINPLVLNLTENSLTGSIVDLGTGPGNVIDYLLRLDVTNKIIGVDFTQEFCANLKMKYQDSKQIEIICNDFVQFVSGLPNNSVSAYTANYSIIHVPNEELDDLFENIQRSLQKNGMFAFSVWKGTKKGMDLEPYQTQHDPRLKVNEQLES